MSETIPTPQRPTELPPEIAAKLEKRKRFPRARRWLFKVAAALSLVLFVGNYWLWLRGARGIEDRYVTAIGIIPFSENWLALSSYGGHISYSSEFWDEYHDAKTGFQSFERNLNVTGFPNQQKREDPRAIEWFHFSRSGSGYSVSIPTWFLQLLFVVYPLWWLGRFAWRWADKKKVRSA